MQPELQVLLPRPVVDDGVDEGHDGGLDGDVVAVGAGGTVQVVHHALKAGALARVLLK